MGAPLIAIVDDESQTRSLIRGALESSGYAVIEADNGQGAIDLLDQSSPSLMILDVKMPGLSGIDALPQILAKRPDLIVLVLTAYVDLKQAVQIMKAGARDYLEKPIDLDELVTVIGDALGHHPAAPRTQDKVELPESVVGNSPAIQAVYREAMRAAKADVPILIYGENGTGKEVLADLIRQWSGKQNAPFEALNCAALPENLIESELFGHVAGAFTGAVKTRVGRFEAAHNGILFLDEIGEMPLPLQAKLLRVLEQRQVRRLGDTRDIDVNFRLIAATLRDLDEEVKAGRFREDLLYRLKVIPLKLPPLRDRPEDILELAKKFLSARNKRLSPAAQRCLLNYGWPGNIRELKNVMARAAILVQGSLILPKDLPQNFSSAANHDSEADPNQLIGSMEEIQKRAILAALKQTDGNRTQAAKILHISRRNLIYKLRSYGL